MYSCRTPIVSSKAQRKKVIDWMNEQHAQNGTESGLCVAAVAKFPTIFRVHDEKSRSNCMKKASRWYKERDCFISSI